MLRQTGDVSFANQLAGLQNSHSVAHQFDLAEQVRIDEDGFALVFELLKEGANFAAAHRIDAVGRLIQKNHVGIVKERLGNSQALLHALGVSPDLVMHPTFESDQLQHFGDAFLALGPGHAQQAAVEFQQAVSAMIVRKAVIFRQIANATEHGRRSRGFS